MPQSRSATTPSCRKRIAANTAPVPQNAFASVNQSASWKSRSMLKWRCFIGQSPGNRAQPAKSGVKAANCGVPTLPRIAMTSRCIPFAGHDTGIDGGWTAQ